jgi:hypothetical protein
MVIRESKVDFLELRIFGVLRVKEGVLEGLHDLSGRNLEVEL